MAHFAVSTFAIAPRSPCATRGLLTPVPIDHPPWRQDCGSTRLYGNDARLNRPLTSTPLSLNSSSPTLSWDQFRAAAPRPEAWGMTYG